LKTVLSIVVCLLLTLMLFYTGLYIGSFETNFNTLVEVLTSYDSGDKLHYAVVHLRIPRLILAFVTGASLAFSGYLMQAMINNPLADPYILGTASGAALGANVAFFGIIPVMVAGIYMPPLLAFAGAVAVTLVVIVVASQKGTVIPSQLLLAGIAISSLIASVISLMTFLSDTEGKLRNIVFWLLGSFERAQWSMLPLPITALLLAVPLFIFMSKQINILLLGEGRAYNLGLNVARLRLTVLLSSALLTALVVAASGPIGFVGLLVPHLIRALFGVNYRLNILYTSWIGGLFMLSCDLLARVIYPPAGIPVGIITSFLGIPFFVYLLSKKNYRFN
jgi:iron complex transport system permease protein